MPSLHERLEAATGVLLQAGIPREEAARDAALLARDVLGWDRAALIARRRDPLPADLEPAYSALVARRATREPVAYIRGHQEFWGLHFDLTPDVLIPRPETEGIIEEALALAPPTGYRRIVDVGTGSGCLAIALALECPRAAVLATDVSAAALAVARRNVDRHHLESRITLVECDLLEHGGPPADLIVSNPPYVPTADAPHLQPEVRDHEPASALFGGDDGLSVMHRLLATAADHLASAGMLIVEFGAGQEPAMQSMAAASGWHVIRVRADLQAIPRIAILRR